MEFFFIPGRNQALSKAELKAVCSVFLPEANIADRGEYFTVSKTQSGEKSKSQRNQKSQSTKIINDDQNDFAQRVDEAFKRTGGFTKYGVFLPEDIELHEIFHFRGKLTASPTSKFFFGVSSYTDAVDYRELSKFAKAVKKSLKAHDLRAAFILPKNGTELNTAQIIHNHLLDKGFELNLFERRSMPAGGAAQNEPALQLGLTLAVQDIAAYTHRDVNRPYADTEMGMLPPKLARMMVNLLALEPGSTIWDPFAGSGGIGFEALLLGYNVMLSDKSPESVVATSENIKWLAENYDLKNAKVNTFTFDIYDRSGTTYKKILKSNISGIVFEPYMGPPQRKVLEVKKAKTLVAESTALLSRAFQVFNQIEHRPLKLVAVIPSYKTTHGWLTPKRKDFVHAKRWRVPKELEKQNLTWERPNSIIRRNILVLERV